MYVYGCSSVMSHSTIMLHCLPNSCSKINILFPRRACSHHFTASVTLYHPHRPCRVLIQKIAGRGGGKRGWVGQPSPPPHLFCGQIVYISYIRCWRRDQCKKNPFEKFLFKTTPPPLKYSFLCYRIIFLIINNLNN